MRAVTRRLPEMGLRARTLLLVVAAALPSAVWLLEGPDLLTDDYGHALSYREHGLWGGLLDRSFESTGRPLVGPYYLLTFGLIGDHPAVHAIVLGTLNVALTLAVWHVGRRLLDPQVAWFAALLVAVLPNRDSTRLWFSTGNYVLATTLVVVGFGLLAAGRRPRFASATFLVAILLFEGVAGLVGGLLLLWMWGDRHRWATGIWVGLPGAVAAAAMYLLSPKREPGGPTPSDSLATLREGLLGEGLWGAAAGRVGALLLISVIGVALVTLLPSFRRDDAALRHIRAGALLAVAGAVPFVVGGSPFAVAGVFDRTNLVPSLGVCLLLAAVAGWLARGPLAGAAVMMLCGCLLLLSVTGVAPYREAVREGAEITDRLIASGPQPGGSIVVVPRPSESAGVAPFFYPFDLDAALRLRTDLRTTAVIPWDEPDCRRFDAQSPQAVGLDWRTGEALSVADACGRL